MQFFAFSSTNSDHDRESGDLISLEFQDYRAFQQYWGVTTAGDGSEVSSAALHNWMTETSPDSTWMYVEMIRESVESLTVSLYTDSDYSSLDRTESLALSSDVNGLRYLKLQSHSSTNCDTSTMVKIDDISFFNGMTEAR